MVRFIHRLTIKKERIKSCVSWIEWYVMMPGLIVLELVFFTSKNHAYSDHSRGIITRKRDEFVPRPSFRYMNIWASHVNKESLVEAARNSMSLTVGNPLYYLSLRIKAIKNVLK